MNLEIHALQHSDETQPLHESAAVLIDQQNTAKAAKHEPAAVRVDADSPFSESEEPEFTPPVLQLSPPATCDGLRKAGVQTQRERSVGSVGLCSNSTVSSGSSVVLSGSSEDLRRGWMQAALDEAYSQFRENPGAAARDAVLTARKALADADALATDDAHKDEPNSEPRLIPSPLAIAGHEPRSGFCIGQLSANPPHKSTGNRATAAEHQREICELASGATSAFNNQPQTDDSFATFGSLDTDSEISFSDREMTQISEFEQPPEDDLSTTRGHEDGSNNLSVNMGLSGSVTAVIERISDLMKDLAAEATVSSANKAAVTVASKQFSTNPASNPGALDQVLTADQTAVDVNTTTKEVKPLAGISSLNKTKSRRHRGAVSFCGVSSPRRSPILPISSSQPLLAAIVDSAEEYKTASDPAIAKASLLRQRFLSRCVHRTSFPQGQGEASSSHRVIGVLDSKFGETTVDAIARKNNPMTMTQSYDRKQMLRDVHCAMDHDKTGSLNREQLLKLGRARRQLGHKGGVWTQQRNLQLLERLDFSGNGLVEADEFVEYFNCSLSRNSDEFVKVIQEFMEAAATAQCSLKSNQTACVDQMQTKNTHIAQKCSNMLECTIRRTTQLPSGKHGLKSSEVSRAAASVAENTDQAALVGPANALRIREGELRLREANMTLSSKAMQIVQRRMGTMHQICNNT